MQVRALVSTVAFGMGVNVRDIRYVIHWDPPRRVAVCVWTFFLCDVVGLCLAVSTRGYGPNSAWAYLEERRDTAVEQREALLREPELPTRAACHALRGTGRRWRRCVARALLRRL